MYRIYKKIPHLDDRDFKSFVKRNFTAHFRELPEDAKGITYMDSLLE